MIARLIPELEVEDLDRSLTFYTGVIGCTVLYARPEERFVMLELEGSNLMLEEAAGPGRRFHTAPLEHPFGRGVNFQIQVANADDLYARVLAAQSHVILPMEERWYRRDDHGGSRPGGEANVNGSPDGCATRAQGSVLSASADGWTVAGRLGQRQSTRIGQCPRSRRDL